MKKKENIVFENQQVIFDGTSWYSCTFRNCEIIVNTGDLSAVSCTFEECKLTLGPNAANILALINLFSSAEHPPEKKFALLVGNGFTVDFAIQHNLDSSSPLKNFDNLNVNYAEFIDYLPTLKNKLLGQDISDFEAIKDYLLQHKTNSHEECELRRFLAIAYSHFQLQLNQYDMSNWKWVKWLQQNKLGLSCAISLNYDVVLENALTLIGASYSRIGTNERPGKIPVLKPHGSIDFDLSENFISCPIQERWGMMTNLNDAGLVNVIPKSDWLLPRIEADIIPPSINNIQRNLSWVNEMFNVYDSKAKKLDALVIVGSSYWDVDRAEIDFFLEKLPKTAIVYIANPEPHKELIKKLSALGLTYETFAFDELPW
ncbi:hypothetical protein COL72_08415 [Bacillus toyonensis]|uniref:hypothetical protein n=1 Tax=Bacillus toyonensis TaxID=155322 RepID=UPI000BF2BBE8|nr:hypothetical protein [Bacillus toyonensis]PFZ73686.1 hypothetical protein COL72_08415 [Bacillus toyonensis]